MRSKSTAREGYREDIRREVEELCSGLDILDIPYSQATIDAFRKYLAVLYRFREKLHLLSRRDYERISRRHFITSLMAYPYVTKCTSACDVGAGAGFPSVPLKIVLPCLHLTLYESIKKKARFLDCLIQELQLENVEVRNERAEDSAGPRYDLVLLKAVGRVATMIKTIDSLVHPGGIAAFYKTHRVEKEIKEAHTLIARHGFTVEVKKLYTPDEQLPLALVFLRKTSFPHTR